MVSIRGERPRTSLRRLTIFLFVVEYVLKAPRVPVRFSSAGWQSKEEGVWQFCHVMHNQYQRPIYSYLMAYCCDSLPPRSA